MADVYKRLGAVYSNGGNQVLYLVPDNTATIIDGVTICHLGTSTSDSTFSIAHVVGGTTPGNIDRVYYDYLITPKFTVEGVLKGRTMSAGDSLVVTGGYPYCISFTVGGVEKTNFGESYKRLGAVFPDSQWANNFALYVVPSSKSTVIGGVCICNLSADIYTFRIAHVDGAIGNLSAEDWVYYDMPISGKTTIEGLLKGRAMSTGDTLVVQGGRYCIFSVSGVEMEV